MIYRLEKRLALQLSSVEILLKGGFYQLGCDYKCICVEEYIQAVFAFNFGVFAMIAGIYKFALLYSVLDHK